MQLLVTHLTRYDYPEPAWDSFNELWVHPVEDFRQSLLSFHLEIEPSAHLTTRRDFYGNVCHSFQLGAPHASLEIRSETRVLTTPGPAVHPMPFSWIVLPTREEQEFLMPTQRVPLDQDWGRMLGLPSREPEDDMSEFINTLNTLLHERFTYAPGATHVNTPLTEFLETRNGVCQDYAHAMLAVLRRQGVPARYVSGYLHTGLGCHGSHAWVEAYFPHLGWAGYDPTNGVRVDEQYVKLAHGRDYDDCPPLKGQRRGGGQEILTVEVNVELVQEPVSTAELS